MRSLRFFDENGRGRLGRGFTLMELLVVMAVIGILAGMLFPAATSVMRYMRKTQAVHAASELRKAITSYSAEYRRWPVRGESEAAEDLEVTSEKALMGVLLASNREKADGGLNPRARVFFTGKRVSDEQRPRNGILYLPGGSGELYDPWGHPYRVILDTSHDERCSSPSDANETVALEVLVWSAGENGVDDRGEGDDVAVW